MELPRVALISEEYPPFTFGGIASVCYDLAHALSRKEVPTTVFCGRAEKLMVEKVNDNLRIIRLPCFDFPPRFLWFQAQNLGLFSRLLKDYPVLHIVNPDAGASIAYFGKRSGKRVVTSIHGVHLYGMKKHFASPFSSWILRDIGYQFFTYPLTSCSHGVCLRNSDYVAVCSKSTLGELKSVYPDLDLNKVSVIPNGIDFERARDSELVNAENELSIIFYGRLYWVKGIQYLIRATAYLKEDFPGLRVQIFGEGPSRSTITHMISDLGLEKNIVLHGFVPREELFKKIREASLVVLPSIHEAQPVSMLEAMACKKPVVAFDFPFSNELVQNMYNGLLAKSGDVKDLSDKIRLLLTDRQLRLDLGQNAYEYVEKSHNWDTLAEKYIELYLGKA